MTHVVVLADTHIRRGSSRRLPDAVYDHLATADLVLHAGDILVQDVLEELSGFAPVHAVLGNNDRGLDDRLPERLALALAGVRVAMVHDSGPAAGRSSRLRRWFPDADVVVFGHSHIPLHEERDGFQIFNPGSPTARRRAPRHTMGLARAARGCVEFELIDLD